MFKRCGALVLGLLVLSSSAAVAQGHCRNNRGPLVNGLAAQGAYGAYGASYGVQSGAFYDARTGGRYVNPNNGIYNNGVYSAAGVSSNVGVYQDQLRQTAQVQAYNQAYGNPYGNAYGNTYANASGYGGANYNGYDQYNQGYAINQPGHVTVTPIGQNPWNGYVSNTYNGYTYPTTVQPGFQNGNNCRPRGQRNYGGAGNPYGRFWVSR